MRQDSWLNSIEWYPCLLSRFDRRINRGYDLLPLISFTRTNYWYRKGYTKSQWTLAEIEKSWHDYPWWWCLQTPDSQCHAYSMSLSTVSALSSLTLLLYSATAQTTRYTSYVDACPSRHSASAHVLTEHWSRVRWIRFGCKARRGNILG